MVISKHIYHGGILDGEKKEKDRHVSYCSMGLKHYTPDPDHRIASIESVYCLDRIEGRTAHYRFNGSSRIVKKQHGESI